MSLDLFHEALQKVIVSRSVFTVPCRSCGGDGQQSAGFSGQIEDTTRCLTCGGTGYIERTGAPV